MKDITPPPGLPDPQQTIWADTVTRLQQIGLLDRADPNHLRAYTAAVHQHQQATHLIDQTAVLIDDHGTPRPNPALTVAARAERRIAYLARTLALTSRGAPLAGVSQAEPMRPPRPAGGRWCDEHKRWECTGSRSRGRGQCHGSAVAGLPVCRVHMGRGTGRHLAAVVQRDFPLAVEPVDIHPGEALLWRVRYLTAFLRAVDAEVARLSREEVGWGLERTEESDLGTRVVRSSRLNVWLDLQDRTGKALVAASAAALQANAEERLVRMAEAQGARAYAAYQRGLSRLGLSEGQWEAARAGYAEVLQELVS